MAMNLVQYARGYQEGWYSALLLDDQPYTIEPEKEKLAEANIDHDVQVQAYEFMSVFMDWLEDFEGLDNARRMETQRVLVIDVNIPELPDVRPLAAIAKVEPPTRPQDTLTANGTRAGLVLIETILRKSKRYRQFPIVVLSAYGIQGGENRLERIKKKPGAPVFYLDKANSSGKDPNLFRDVVMELLSDQRLLIVERIANFWKLEIEQVCGVLGLRKNDARLVAKMFDRGEVFPSKDPDERVELIKTIYRELCGLLRDREAIIGWLNSTNKSLNGETPLNLMSSADFEKLAIVKHYVDFLCQS
jgi:Protein of unknown function (DUF2384)